MQKRKLKDDEAKLPARRLLSRQQVLELVGSPSYSTLWSWMKKGAFPPAVELGPSGSRSSSIAWFEHEVLDWIESRPRRQLGTHEFRGRNSEAASKAAARGAR
jgi:prophage regulatory protein